MTFSLPREGAGVLTQGQEDVWTQERALEKLRQFAAEGLDAARIRQEDPQTYARISSAFGSFWKACHAAGVVEVLRPPLPADPDKATLVALIEEYSKRNRLGRVLLDRGLMTAISQKFAQGLPEALTLAGVPVPGLYTGDFNKEQLDEFLTQWAREEGGVVAVKQLTQEAKDGIRRWYGSYQTAGEVLGIRFEGEDTTDLPGSWTQERALAILRQLAAQGFDLTKTSQEKPAIYSGVTAAFGSFRAACEAAGLPYEVEPKTQLNLDKHDLVRLIQRYYQRGTLGRFILDEVLVSACNRKFAEHLKGALAEAGVPDPRAYEGSLTEEMTRELLQQWAREENGKVEVGRLVRKARLAIRRWYGSLEAASQALGIEFVGTDDDLPPVKPRGRASWKVQPPKKEKPLPAYSRHPAGYWTEERILEEVRRRLTDEKNPFSLKNKEDRRLYAAATQHLGSFHEAARRVGLVYIPSRRRGPKKKDREAIAQQEISLAETLIAERAKDGAVNLADLPPQVESILVLKFGGLQVAANALNLTITSMDGRTYKPIA